MGAQREYHTHKHKQPTPTTVQKIAETKTQTKEPASGGFPPHSSLSVVAWFGSSPGFVCRCRAIGSNNQTNSPARRCVICCDLSHCSLSGTVYIHIMEAVEVKFLTKPIPAPAASRARYVGGRLTYYGAVEIVEPGGVGAGTAASSSSTSSSPAATTTRPNVSNTIIRPNDIVEVACVNRSNQPFLAQVCFYV